VDLYFGIDYTPDLQQAEDLALEAVRALDPPLRNPDRPVEFFYEEWDTTSFSGSLDRRPATFLKARSEAFGR
jgi:hypothetical protein